MLPKTLCNDKILMTNVFLSSSENLQVRSFDLICNLFGVSSMRIVDESGFHDHLRRSNLTMDSTKVAGGEVWLIHYLQMPH